MSGTAGRGSNCKAGVIISTSEVVGERGVGRAEVRVGRMVRKREREKREIEREVVVGEGGSIFFWGFGFGGRGVDICW